MDKKIVIPARKMKHVNSNSSRCIVRLNAEAYNALVDIYNESSLSLAQVASTIILQGKDLVVYEKEG